MCLLYELVHGSDFIRPGWGWASSYLLREIVLYSIYRILWWFVVCVILYDIHLNYASIFIIWNYAVDAFHCCFLPVAMIREFLQSLLFLTCCSLQFINFLWKVLCESELAFLPCTVLIVDMNDLVAISFYYYPGFADHLRFASCK